MKSKSSLICSSVGLLRRIHFYNLYALQFLHSENFPSQYELQFSHFSYTDEKYAHFITHHQNQSFIKRNTPVNAFFHRSSSRINFSGRLQFGNPYLSAIFFADKTCSILPFRFSIPKSKDSNIKFYVVIIF